MTHAYKERKKNIRRGKWVRAYPNGKTADPKHINEKPELYATSKWMSAEAAKQLREEARA